MTSDELSKDHHLLDTSTDCVKAIGLDGRLLTMNPEGMCLMEIDDFSVVQGAAWDALWPERHRDTLRAAVAKATEGKVARFAADCPTAKGTPKHWDVVVSPVHDVSGQLVQLLAISRDVTREVLVAGERALVMRELAHRMQNLFAVFDSMIGMSARSAPQALEFAQSLRARLAGLGRSFAYIYNTQDEAPPGGAGRTLQGLLRDLLGPYGFVSSGAGKVSVAGDDHAIAEQAVTPLALIINELATNSLKHGALKTPDGAVSVHTANRADMYEIDWVETGAGAVSAPAKTGFGTTLLDRMVKLQMRGEITRDWAANGLRVRVTLPAAQLGAVPLSPAA